MSLLHSPRRFRSVFIPTGFRSFARRKRPTIEHLEDRTAPAIFTVISTADINVPGTLRNAIESANLLPGVDDIVFDIANGPQTITLDSPLPIFTEAIRLNATTQPGFAGAPLISIVGSNLAAGDGIVVGNNAGGSTIRGLNLRSFPGNGIAVFSDSNTIETNFIGTNAAGDAAAGNGLNGIFLNNASNNFIGGQNPNDRNVISGNAGNGIAIVGSSSFNIVIGNRIGTNAAGATAVGNAADGIVVNESASSNTLGSAIPGAGNVISGNRNGIALLGNSSGSIVVGNKIGTNLVGDAAIGNLFNGVLVLSTENAIGNNLGGGNAIAFNNARGVFVANGNASVVGNSIFGNSIGLAVTGLGVLNAQTSNTFANAVSPNTFDFEVDLTAFSASIGAVLNRVAGTNQVTLSAGAPINTSPISLEAINTLSIRGGTGGDALTVDLANGNPLPGGGTTYDGGNTANGSIDSLTVQNGALTAQTFSNSGPNAGTFALDEGIGLGPTPIHYQRIRTVTSTIPSPTVNLFVSAFNGTRGELSDQPGGFNRLASTSSPTAQQINFLHPADALNIDVLSGTLLYNSLLPIGGGKVDVQGGAVLGGIGNIGGPVDVEENGAVSPGNSPGTVGTGDLSLKSGSTLDEEIDGVAPVDYDRINVTGAVNINTNARLHIFLGYTPANGDSFTIIDNDAADPVTGNFKDYNSPFSPLPEGTNFAADGNIFRISYIGGTGNDVVLTVANPAVTSVAPAMGPTAGGTPVLITGFNFTGMSSVDFDGSLAAFSVLNDNVISATAPPGILGSADVTVTKLGVSNTLLGGYTYAEAPQVDSFVTNGGPMYAVDSYGFSPTGLAGKNSIVTQLYVEFDIGVTLAPGAFKLDAGTVSVNITGGISPVAANNDVVSIVVDTDLTTLDANGGYKGYRLRFASNLGFGNGYFNTFNNGPTGTGGIGNIATALKDGFYRLNIIGGNVHAGASLAGATMAGNHTEGFWVLYGSTDPSDRSISSNPGDGNSVIATNASVIGFAQTNGSGRTFMTPPYNENYDWNLDGDIGDDLIEFAKRFGMEWQF
jgi:hypothetical protein